MKLFINAILACLIVLVICGCSNNGTLEDMTKGELKQLRQELQQEISQFEKRVQKLNRDIKGVSK